jgi:glutathione S-transferase
MLKVWGRRSSMNVQKVLWLVAELGLPREHVELGGKFGGLDEPAFRAMNPHGRVPVIDDGGVVVWESHAILRYLAARHGSGNIWRADPAARSQVDRWIEWSQATLQPAFIDGIFVPLVRTPPSKRDSALVEKNVRHFNELFRLLESVLDKDPGLGKTELSLADFPIGAHLYRYFEMDIQRPSLPRIEAWYERLRQRPGYRENIMVSFEELRAHD